MEIFVIYDTVGGFFETPFFGVNIRTVERGISDLPSFQANHPLCVHSNDYVLYHLGTFSTSDCSFALFEKPVFINNISAYIRTVSSEQGAAVGDAIPLKSQSADIEDTSDASEHLAACDEVSSTLSKAQNGDTKDA